jgi:predicted RNA-binding Zn-ribbon protein involved in translation (DUF1610 family)
MKDLGGASIYVGKDPNQDRLIVSLRINGKIKSAVLDSVRGVPPSVSRAVPAENIAHCRIDVDENGQMQLHNLKEQNVTFVNNVAVLTKKIFPNSVVELGRDNFQMPLDKVLDVSRKIMNEIVPPKPVSIVHLKAVWEEREAELDRIALKQQKRNKQQRIPIMIGAASGVIVPVLATTFSAKTLYFTLPIAVIVLLCHIRVFFDKDTSNEEKKAADQKLFENYVCPKCKRFLRNQHYRELSQNTKCPYCGIGWSVKE